MRYDKEKHHRRSIRLKNYDYSQAGAYFVTICTQGRECLFGEIKNNQMHLNEAGGMGEKVWNELPEKYPGVEIDELIVMPNHIHGIIILSVGAGPCACPETETNQSLRKGQPQGVAPTRLSLPDVVHRYKSFTTSQYRTGVEQFNWLSFPGKLWQRNYYEHIIRNEDDLNSIREYIRYNPLKWDEDEENPDNKRRGNS